MKNSLVVLSLLFSMISCQPSSQESVNTTEVTEKVDQNAFSLEIEKPVLSSSLTPDQINSEVNIVVGKIDNSLDKLRLVETKMTLDQVENTPVKVWYSNEQAYKIEYGVSDDSGEFTDVFQLYFINGKVWFSNQIYAKYVFDEDRLQFWLDPNWNMNQIDKKDFIARGEQIKNTVSSILSQVK